MGGIAEMTDDSMPSTECTDSQHIETDKSTDYHTDSENLSESDEIERAEIEKRRLHRDKAAAVKRESVAIQTQIMHLQVGSDGNQNWISTDTSMGADSDNVPICTPVLRETHSLITREVADAMSTEELTRQKLEMQEQMAALMMVNSL